MPVSTSIPAHFCIPVSLYNKNVLLRCPITGESDYCPRSFRKMPHRRGTDILNRLTEYCSELYNYKAKGDPSVLSCPKTDTEDDHTILQTEVEAAVQSLKKGKSARVDNIPAELVQAGRKDLITALTTICNKIWQTGEWKPHGPSP